MLKGKIIIGVCAGRFHTVLYTRNSVFTFGLNAGQLGEKFLHLQPWITELYINLRTSGSVFHMNILQFQTRLSLALSN